MKRAVIAGIDSGLGSIIASHLASKEWQIEGTTRRSGEVSNKYPSDFNIYNCDFSNLHSIDTCVSQILSLDSDWQVLILAIGSLEPIGDFSSIDFNLWQSSFHTNFIGQMNFIQKLLRGSSTNSNQLVLTFAGGGTNGSTSNFSSYTLAKIALIKGMELLSTEIPNSKFVSLGTGWMDTPIHTQTIKAGLNAGQTYLDTLNRIEKNDFGKVSDLLDFVDWAISADKEIVSGRNFSLQNDPWREKALTRELLNDSDMFKLRRFRNFEGSLKNHD
jgi:NAD(P)-dependent dehydrogenase (short-subunit alcohol dehydrogenase family)